MKRTWMWTWQIDIEKEIKKLQQKLIRELLAHMSLFRNDKVYFAFEKSDPLFIILE